MAEKPNVLREVDDEARALARRLVRTARFGALAFAGRDGGPEVGRVAVANDMGGNPVFIASRLSPHFGGVEAEPRCSILLGEPGRGDPLAHPRITATGLAKRIDRESPEHQAARRRHLGRHPKAELYVDFPDFAFFRITPTRASLNGGFGQAYALKPDDFTTQVPEGFAELEAGAVEHMNADHAEAITLYAERLAGAGAGRWRLASFDPEGLDLAEGDRLVRLPFEPPLKEPGELRPRLVEMAKAARASA